MRKYRVLEHQNKFYIQTEVTFSAAKGFWWWYKETKYTKWVNVNSEGKKPFMIPYSLRMAISGYEEPELPPFDTLQDAFDKIKVFSTADKIHEV